jgi:hypothetical protein
MFSPSLTSMLLHSLWIDAALIPGHTPLPRASDVDDDLRHLLHNFRDSRLPMPSVPIGGHAENIIALGRHVQASQDVDHGSGHQHVFGRVPVDVLVTQFHTSCRLPEWAEYLDLGTSLKAAQHFHRTGLTNCLTWLSNHPLDKSKPARMTVAVIDRGTDLPPNHQQETLGGRVDHLINDVDFSEHASLVLSEVIGRLASHGLLNSCDLVCALIKPPAKPIGRKCFRHANIVELAHAMRVLSNHVSGPNNPRSSLPLVTNLSMGTHIGPHDGLSPLENFIDRRLPFAQQRYLVCSAGNDGLAGLSARCELRNGARDFMRIQTSPIGCEDILVELWWEEPQDSTMSITVRVCDRQKYEVCMPLFIDTSGKGSLITGAKLATANPGFNSVVCESLYHARCRGIFSCAAFAMSARTASDLANLTIDIEMRCSEHSSVAVNAWIVVADNNGATFVGGGSSGTITVPATYDHAISVAGVEDVPNADPALRPQPWQESSRGPAANYGQRSWATLPKLAHRVDGSVNPTPPSGYGTSFAAPRAAADVVESVLRAASTIHDPELIKRYADADELARSVVARHGTNPPTGVADRDRIGFGTII